MKNHSARAVFLLLFLGLVWGSGYSLARYAVTHDVSPLGYACWQSLGPAIILLVISRVMSGALPVSWRHIRYYAVCGAIGIAIPNTNMYWSAQHVSSGLLAVVVNTVPVLIYVLSIVLRQERFNLTRCLGIMACMLGIYMIVMPSSGGLLSGLNQPRWVWTSLLTPLCFALCALYSARFRPEDCSSLQLAAGMLTASVFFLLPLVLMTHHFYVIWPPFHLRDGVIVLEIILSSLGYCLFFKLLKDAGPVYYSLVGGVVALVGLAAGVLLFGERFKMLESVAMLCIIVGIFLVTIQRVQKA